MREKLTVRSLPLLLSSFTTSIALVLVALQNQRDIGSFNIFVSQHRDTLALFIQVISSGLGACQVYAVASVLNYWYRLYLQHNPVTLESLKLWTAITGLQVRTSLPVQKAVLLAAFVILLKIPEALWAGALTPIYVDYTTPTGAITIPTYDQNSAVFWEGQFQKYDDGSTGAIANCMSNSAVSSDTGADAFVTTCPAIDHHGGLLASAGSASTPLAGKNRVHSRIDSSGWINNGRSYGVGSSPGIVAVSGLASKKIIPKAFSYHERGYDSQVQCRFNEASNFIISDLLGDLAGQRVYLANGSLPNSKPGVFEQYSIAAGTGAPELFAWTTVYNLDQYMLATAGAGWYNTMDKIQCNVLFEPAKFLVDVNTTSKSIEVTRIAPNTMSIDLEPSGRLTQSVFLGLEVVSRMAGQTLVATLGNALKYNSMVAQGQFTNKSSPAVFVKGVEDSITAMLDDLFIAYGQAQIVLLKNSTTSSIVAEYNAIRIGSDRYIYSTLGSCVLVLMLVVMESVRTRFWRNLSRFDFTDIQSMTIAASTGGESISKYVRTSHAGIGSRWQGDPGDRLAGGTVVKLQREDASGFALIKNGEAVELEEGGYLKVHTGAAKG